MLHYVTAHHRLARQQRLASATVQAGFKSRLPRKLRSSQNRASHCILECMGLQAKARGLPGGCAAEPCVAAAGLVSHEPKL